MLDPQTYLRRTREATDFLAQRCGEAPEVCAVLGSGLGDFLDNFPGLTRIPYREIPGFPTSAVVGHAGVLAVSSSAPLRFAALMGRSHAYEGLPLSEIVFPVRTLALWGAQSFIITNAAGAINRDFEPGDLVLIRDHINLIGDNPLCGPNINEFGERFPDLTRAYDDALATLAREKADQLSIPLKEGVYVAFKGPSYETPAEIRMCGRLGADLVGMSSVPEVIALNHMKRKVLGLSCVTNMAAGLLPRPLRHEEVLETTTRIRDRFSRLLVGIIEEISHEMA